MDQMEMSVICRQRRAFAGLRRCLTAPAWAAVLLGVWIGPLPALAGSNFPQDYPAHQCGERPEPPERPEKFGNRSELDDYNEKVDAYNTAMERYVGCLQRYVDNAASDIRAIRDKIDAALEAVNP